MIGETLGRYRILEEIGAGGMGIVYRARDERLDRDVALKVLPAGTLADEHSRKRFRREALALSKLNHPAIATVHDFDTQQGVDFLVMELIPGVTLDHKLAAGPLPAREALSLGTQLVQALAGAHEEGVVHRDLKPANLRVTPDGRLKVLDFGLASLRWPEIESGAMTETALTGPGAAAGTLPYMAPEQLRGGPVDRRADLYAAGGVLYEMVTGRRPFTETRQALLVDAILNRAPEPPGALNPAVPPELQGVILKALDKAPERRYQTARELLSDLERVATTERPRPARWPLVAAAAGLALAGLIAVVHFRLTAPGAPAPSIRSLAVLPLENLTRAADQDYFADGLTEALIAELGKLGELSVISRTSVMRYRDTTKPLPQIARELNVDAVVEGSVLRAGDRVRITAQLIHGQTDRHLWAESYERDLRDVLALQGEVARAIAAEVRLKMAPSASGPLRPVNREAYESYLKGRYSWNQRTAGSLRTAIGHFEQALAADPRFALGHAGLASSYVLLGGLGVSALPPGEAAAKAKSAARRALELDEGLAEAQAALAYTLALYDWDWSGAEAGFRRAIELNPSYATAHFWYAATLGALGRTEESLQESRRAQELDPLSPIITAGRSWTYHLARRDDEAIAEARKALELAPDFAIGRYRLGIALGYKNAYADAIRELKEGVAASGGSPDFIAELARIHAEAGQRQEAERLLQELLVPGEGRYVAPYTIATVHAALGQRERALEWLERAYAERPAPHLSFLKVERDVESLRTDPRFADLLRRVGLAD
jgi:serine/threonine-protein kinase